MFFLSKLFNWIFLSPLVFIIMITAGYFLLKRSKRAAAFLILGAAGILYFCSLRPIKNIVVHPLEYRYRPAAIAKVKYILVAGGGVVDRSPENGRPSLTESSLRRTITAYQWWKKNKVPIVLCGGSPLKNGHPEAEAMRDFLLELGVPQKYLKAEPYSRNTYENILNAKRLLELNNNDKIAVITSAVHLPRTIAICRKFKLNYLPVPTGYLTDLTSYSWFDIFPSALELNQVFGALHEYVGVVYYKIRYRI